MGNFIKYKFLKFNNENRELYDFLNIPIFLKFMEKIEIENSVGNLLFIIFKIF